MCHCPLPTGNSLCTHDSMPRQEALAACLVAAVLLQLLLPAQAHMVMIEPKSRQWLDYTLRYNYNPHAVNGGGRSCNCSCLCCFSSLGHL